MTPLEDFKKILKEHGIEGIPEESIVVFRDLIDVQSDMILDRFIEDKFRGESPKNVVK